VAAPAGPDDVLARRLAAHELRVHAWGGREIRDLGDALLLYDPGDPEPYWTRLSAPVWPRDTGAFDRRLDEIVTLFASLGRLPHLRTLAAGAEPPDLGERLTRAAFRIVGRDQVMVLDDPEPAARLAASLPSRRGIAVERLGHGGEARAMDVARLLVQAFEVEADRVPSLGAESLAAGRRPGGSVLLLLEAGVPAAVARRTTLDGLTYLSSIATAPALRRRGHASLVTALAIREALEAGSELVHLLVDARNDGAIRMYEDLGFRPVGEPSADFVLR
jgi:ribosomal protein S18 acetylase RimI-like enzyme